MRAAVHPEEEEEEEEEEEGEKSFFFSKQRYLYILPDLSKYFRILLIHHTPI